MKAISALCVMLAAGALLTGCAANKNGLVLDAVGPVPGSTATGKATSGTLLVYSAFEANATFNNRDPYRPECSDYKIFTADGKLLKLVHNVTDNVFQSPVPVSLPPGAYKLVARANGYGVVTVPVVIKPQQSTVLHLEGGGYWPDRSGFTENNMSRLPDGRIVGWKSSL